MRSILILALLILSTNSYAQIACFTLNGASVYSNESQPKYLGFFGNSYAGDSIMNQFGSYGSRYASSSVRNQFGTFGSNYSSLSANNSFTSTPPMIIKGGQLIGYLTANKYISNGVSLDQIDSLCTFNAFSSSSNVITAPSQLSGLQAIAGVESISLLWDRTSGASRYDIYVSLSQVGEKTFLQSTTSLSFIATDAAPDVLYYFFVYPVNTAGTGGGMWIASSSLPKNSASDSLWPSNFNGAYPSQRPNLGLNNVGVASESGTMLYSCVAIFSGGRPGVVGGLHKIDIVLELASSEEGIFRILRSREFNQGGDLASDGNSPSCSGAFEVTTGVFEDIWIVGERYFSVRLALANEERLELQLISATEL